MIAEITNNNQNNSITSSLIYSSAHLCELSVKEDAATPSINREGKQMRIVILIINICKQGELF
jgi:hypothetical protein